MRGCRFDFEEVRMIDYDKLKIATELVEKIHLGKFYMTLSTHDGVEYRFYAPINQSLYTNCLDELIEYLNKLNKPEPKYKAGDELHHVHMNIPCSFKATISKWDGSLNQYVYGYNGDWSLIESEIFPTRQALIEAQLTHWRDMLCEELEQDISPYCESKHEHLWVRGKCYDCGAVKFEGEVKGFGYDGHKIEVDTQSNQSKFDVDGCQHEPINTKEPWTLYTESARCPCCNELREANGECSNMNCLGLLKCVKCSAFYSPKCQHEFVVGDAFSKSKCKHCGEFYR